MRMAYGIDLGTTYSAIAKLNVTGNPEIIPDVENGTDTLASAVFFKEDGSVIVGSEAKEEGATAPDRLKQFFKRWIGRGTDPNCEHYLVDGKEYDPIELSAIVLGRIVEHAKAAGEDVKDVVITCPTYFDNAQRDATKQAGKLAGLNVMAIANEPTAAAISYCAAHRNEDQTILVYDLGGATFDVTLLRATWNGTNHDIDVLGTDGDAFLGGYEWDNKLYQLLLAKYEEQYRIYIVEELRAAIRSAVEGLKMRLSHRESVKTKIPYNGEPVALEVTQEEFENATAGYVEQTVGWLNAVLEKANVTDDQVDVVLMVGGSTRMPMIRRMLKERFGEKVVFNDPDTVVAKGAAIIAAMMQAGRTLKEDSNPDNNGFDTQRLFHKLEQQIEQGTARLMYTPTTGKIAVAYSDDDDELIDIFEQLRKHRAILLDEQNKLGRFGTFAPDAASMLSDKNRIHQLRLEYKKVKDSRERIHELIKYNLQENMAGLFRYADSIQKLDENLCDLLANMYKIEEITKTFNHNYDKLQEVSSGEKPISDVELTNCIIKLLPDLPDDVLGETP